MKYNTPLIQTKLYRPVQNVGLVPRKHLTEWLDQRRSRPLTLVSAPAGYGKSTLISEWVGSLDCPSAWISLDEYDNDLGMFLSYFIAAIQGIFPQHLKETGALLSAPELPPMRYLSGIFINELNDISDEFVLVLDDYNLIEEQTIHDFVKELIHYAPQGMHMVLCTRIDPPLPLVKLRATSQVAEIRGQDLIFTKDEGYFLVKNILGTQVDRNKTNSLVKQSEGWVTGIRLAALALRHRENKDHFDGSLSANNQYVMDYLVSEILENQLAIFSEGLLKTSILERMCPDLCEAVCAKEGVPGEPVFDGQEFINWLEATNLFVINLDDQNHWVRYHNLFRDFLQNELARKLSNNDIAVLHSSASTWYAENGLIDEALRHALAAGDDIVAAQLVEENIYKILTTGLFSILERWLDLLPDEIEQQRPKLLLARAWVSHFQGAFERIPVILQKIDNLPEIEKIEPQMKGDLDFFNAVILFWDCQIETSVELFRRAISRMTSGNLGGRNEAELYLAVAIHMKGEGDDVIQKYQRMLHNETSESPRYGYLLASLAFVHFLSGNLAMVYEIARQMAEFGDRTNNAIVSGWGSYLMGYMNFEWNNLETAINYFSKAVDKRFFLDVNSPIDSYAGIIFSYQAIGQPDKANETADLMLEFAQDSKNPLHLILVRSVRARLSLLQGALLSAIRRIEATESSAIAGTMFFWLENPRITQCRLLIARGSDDSLQQAERNLQEYWQQSQDTYNTPKMVEILLLQALIHYKQEQIDEALAALERAVILAQPGGYIRPFVELGSELVKLFNQLQIQDLAPEYIGQILAAFPSEAGKTQETIIYPASQSRDLVEPMTNRESEILELLGKRLTNKEIASQLVISPGTVEQHLVRIYAKLNVRGRRQAVIRARELGLLPSRK